MGEISWLVLISIRHRWVQYLGCGRTHPWAHEIDHPPLSRSYLVVVPLYDISGALILLTGLYGWDSMTGLILILNQWVQYLGGVKDRPLGSRNGPSGIGPQLFGRSAVVWYVKCLVSLNWTLWVRFHGWYWYQYFIDRSNIRGVGRTDPWGHEKDHPPLCRSYLVVVPSYHVSGALILLTGLYWWDSMADLISILHRWVQYLACE